MSSKAELKRARKRAGPDPNILRGVWNRRKEKWCLKGNVKMLVQDMWRYVIGTRVDTAEEQRALQVFRQANRLLKTTQKW